MSELTKREIIVVRILLLICKIIGKDYHTVNGYHEFNEIWNLIKGEEKK